MRTLLPLISLVFTVSASLSAAPRVIEVDGETVVLQLAPEDDVRPGEAATLFFARQLPKQRVEVHVAEIRVLSCEAGRCRAEVLRRQRPVEPGYEMILHRVRETHVLPGGPGGVPASSPTAPVEPPSTSARLHVTGGPVDARVRVDDVAVCAEVPCALEVAAGAHEVRVELEGYMPFTGASTAALGQVSEVEVHLEHRPIIDVQSTPAGVLVQLDGEEVGRTPIAFALERALPGRVALSLEGYELQELEIVPRANETLRLTPLLLRKRLARAEGWRVAGIVATSVGAALASAGGVLLFLGDWQDSRATDLHQRYLALPPGGPPSAYLTAWNDVEAAVERSRRYGMSGASMLGVGAGMTLFGLLAWLDPFDWWVRTAPVAAPTPDGQGASLEWRGTW
jgi:hypothetical protein